MTRGQKVLAFISRYAVTPEGMHVGKPIVLDEFQRKFILAIYDNPHGTDTAILSIARKNGKTALIACIVLAHLVGTEAIQNSRIVSGAMSREQAGEVFNLASKMVLLSPELSKLIRVIPSQKKLIGLPMNVEYQATSAEARTAHGKSPCLAIIDEAGQVQGARSDFIDAITTAQGAWENPLLIYISTQAAQDSDFFSLLIDDALTNKPPKTVCHVYAAAEDAAVDDELAWRAANPALGSFRSIDDVRKQAEKAKRIPSFENTFRNLVLNQRVSTTSPFISRDTWLSCADDPLPLSECDAIYGGLDLSARTDLTSFCLVGLRDDLKHVYSWSWKPESSILEHSKRDKAPYDLWMQQGHIRATPGSSIDYGYIAREILEIVEGLQVEAIAYDRWRIDVFKKELENLGADLPLEPWGQGFKDMSPAVDALENDLLNGRLRHGMNPVLNMCAANATLSRSPAGDRKLDKIKASGRIDAVVALTMACGLAERKGQSSASFDEFINNPLVF